MSIILMTPAELEALIENIIRRVISEFMPGLTGKEDKPITIEEASEHLQMAIQTLYQYTSKRLIPHEKRGKYLRFRKSALDKWLAEGKVFTKDEIIRNGSLDLKMKGGKK